MCVYVCVGGTRVLVCGVFSEAQDGRRVYTEVSVKMRVNESGRAWN
jgi:hypothetical protein